MPGHDASLEARFLGKHRDVFQQVAVRIAKVNCRRRHPSQHHRLVCRLPIEVERGDARRQERSRCRNDALERCRKGDVHRRLVWTRTGRPEAQHSAAAGANPEERRLTRRHDMRQFQSDEIAIEHDGRVEIGDGQVRFKQAIDAHQAS